MYDVYSEKSLTERQCQNWFARFRSRDFDLKDAPRSRRQTMGVKPTLEGEKHVHVNVGEPRSQLKISQKIVDLAVQKS